MKEAFDEGYKKAAREVEEKTKSAFDEGYAKVKDDVIDKIFQAQGEIRAQQHEESFRLGYFKCLDDSGGRAEDERRTLIEVPPLSSAKPSVAEQANEAVDAPTELVPKKDP